MPKTPKRVEFYVCDHCGKPIIPETKYEGSGVIVTGHIKTVDPDGFTSIVGSDFLQTRITVQDMDQCIFHTNCLIGLLKRESHDKETEELPVPPIYVVRCNSCQKRPCYWDYKNGKWTENITEAQKFLDEKMAQYYAENTIAKDGYAKPFVWRYK